MPVFTGTLGPDTLVGGDGNDTLRGLGGDDLLIGGGGNDWLYGGEGNDTALGGEGDDVYVYEAGLDVFEGGPGRDTLVNASPHAVWGHLSGGAVEFWTRDTPSLNHGAWRLLVRASGVFHLTGGAGNDWLRGDAQANHLRGGDGDDLLEGLDNHDRLDGGPGNDTLVGGRGDDTLIGGPGRDAFVAEPGHGHDVVLDFDPEEDWLDLSRTPFLTRAELTPLLAQLGADLRLSLPGGGTMTLRNLRAEQLVEANLRFHNPVIGTAADEELHGTVGRDRMRGGGGQDTIFGHAGDDELEIGLWPGFVVADGGPGFDLVVALALGPHTFWVDLAAPGPVQAWRQEPGGRWIEIARLVNFEGAAGGEHDDVLLGDDGPNLLIGNGGNDRLEGRGGDDTLIGGPGDDTLAGGEGADLLIGGEGVDFADYRASPAGVWVDLAAGIGRGGHAEGDRLSGIEGVFGSPHDDTVMGGEGPDIFVSNGGRDRFDGGGGDDTFYTALPGSPEARRRIEHLSFFGGSGTNTFVVAGGSAVWADLDHVGDQLWTRDGPDLDHGTWRGIGMLQLVQNITVLGSNPAMLLGNRGPNVLIAPGGWLDGKDGDDVIVVTGSIPSTLIGGEGRDLLVGGSGNDTLIGGARADTMIGGLGDDTYHVGDATDVVIEEPGGGHDTVLLSATWTVALNVEVVIRLIPGTTTGNHQGQTLIGSEGNDRLISGGGDDVIEGRGGDDVIVLGDGFSRVDGGPGRDRLSAAGLPWAVWMDLAHEGPAAWTRERPHLREGAWRAIGSAVSIEELEGTAFDDLLGGDAEDNLLLGGAGNDVLLGRAGRDTLTGGAGDDTLDGGEDDDVLNLDGGRDVARFSPAGRHDLLLGFVAARHRLDLSNLGVASAAEALALARGTPAGTLLDFSRLGAPGFDSSALLQGIPLSALSAATFLWRGTLRGTGTGERLEGPEHATLFEAFGGSNAFRGGMGDDRLTWAPGQDWFDLDGGEGRDALDLSAAPFAVWVDLIFPGEQVQTRDGPDLLAGLWRPLGRLASVEAVIGSHFADLLIGSEGPDDLSTGPDGAGDRLYGRGGDDVLRLVAASAPALLDGGEGRDRADFSAFPHAVWVELDYAGPEAWTMDRPDLLGGAWRPIADLVSIEDLVGTAFDDRLAGDEGPNLLIGGPGRDSLDGRGGDDVLIGGPGEDTLTGGAGADLFVFLAPGDWDRVTDFTPGEDRIGIGRHGFGLPFGSGVPPLLIGALPAAPGPVLLYDPAEGRLSFDPDGTGPLPALPVAELGPGRALSAADLVLF